MRKVLSAIKIHIKLMTTEILLSMIITPQIVKLLSIHCVINMMIMEMRLKKNIILLLINLLKRGHTNMNTTNKIIGSNERILKTGKQYLF